MENKNFIIEELEDVSKFALLYGSYKVGVLIADSHVFETFLASTNFYSCMSHTEKVMDSYSEVLDEVYAKINDCIIGKTDINNLLETSVCHSGFKRLN